MAAEPARHLEAVEDPLQALRVIDPNGQPQPLLNYLRPLEDQLAGAEKEIRAWRTRYANLKRDKDAEAKASPYWPITTRLFAYWRRRCRHERAEFTADRFEIALPHVRVDPVLCVRAIDGAAFDPYIPPPGKNGKRRPKNDWGLILRNQEKVRDFAERVRDDWVPPKGFIELVLAEAENGVAFKRLPES